MISPLFDLHSAENLQLYRWWAECDLFFIQQVSQLLLKEDKASGEGAPHSYKRNRLHKLRGSITTIDDSFRPVLNILCF